MTESEEKGVVQDVADPQALDITQAQAHQELSEASQTIDQGLKAKDDQEKNWKALRDKQEQLQREYDRERAKREEYEKMLLQQVSRQPQQQEEVDEFASVSDDDWLTKKQSQKLAQKMAEKAIQDALAKERQRMAEENLPLRLKTQYPDFDAVVSEDNVKQLRALEPDVALALSQIGDKYGQAVAAYKYIKAFIPKAAEQTDYKERVQKNAQKPGSLNSVAGTSALSQAQGFEKGLTNDLKKQLYAEMVKAAKGS